jgi:YggT family protein
VTLICAALAAYTLILFVRIILSWVTMFWSPPPALSPVVRIIHELTEPPMAFFRQFIPPVGGLDLSALFLFLILRITGSVLGC